MREKQKILQTLSFFLHNSPRNSTPCFVSNHTPLRGITDCSVDMMAFNPSTTPPSGATPPRPPPTQLPLQPQATPTGYAQRHLPPFNHATPTPQREALMRHPERRFLDMQSPYGNQQMPRGEEGGEGYNSRHPLCIKTPNHRASYGFPGCQQDEHHPTDAHRPPLVRCCPQEVPLNQQLQAASDFHRQANLTPYQEVPTLGHLARQVSQEEGRGHDKFCYPGYDREERARLREALQKGKVQHLPDVNRDGFPQQCKGIEPGTVIYSEV